MWETKEHKVYYRCRRNIGKVREIKGHREVKKYGNRDTEEHKV